MANWVNPLLTSEYTALLDILKDRDFDLAVMFSPEHSTAANIPTGAIRWNPAGDAFEIRSALGEWGPLSGLYKINVDLLDGQHGSYYRDWNNLTNVPATFAPSAHDHNDLYYTETEADARFGATLDNNGNNLRLRAANGNVLSSLEVAYASAAGNAGTVGGFSVGQNLRPTDSINFASLTTEGDITAKGRLLVGKNGGGDSDILFYDDNSDTWRTLQWDDSVNDWRLEDNTGTFRRIFHEGHLPQWSEISGKPTTFAPAAHSHVFDATNRMQVRSATTAANATLTGLLGELVVDDSNGRLTVHDGTTVGGNELAFKSDIPGPTNLSNYAALNAAVQFTSTLGVTGKVTASGEIQAKYLRVVDAAAASGSKTMMSFEGDSDALRLVNNSAGDYKLKIGSTDTSVTFLNGTGGLQFRVQGTTRVLANSTGVQLFGNALVEGHKIWHAGNDGPDSGLNADLLDGKQASAFLDTSSQQTIPAYTARKRFPSAAAIDVSSAHHASLEIYQPNIGEDAFMAFHVASDFATYFGLDGSINDFVVGGWSMGAVKHRVWHAGNHGAASGLDADFLDGQHGSHYLAWANLTGVPSTFAPSAHSHDDRYYTEAEADGRFAKTSGATFTGPINVNSHVTLKPNNGAQSYLYLRGVSDSGNRGIVYYSDTSGTVVVSAADASGGGQRWFHFNPSTVPQTPSSVLTKGDADATYARRSGQSFTGDVAANNLFSRGNVYVDGSVDASPHILLRDHAYTLQGGLIWSRNNGYLYLRRYNDAGNLPEGELILKPTSVTYNNHEIWHAGNDGHIIKQDTPATGDLEFSGAAGRGIKFWNNDGYSIHMAASTDATYGGRLDTTSDYNMYFDMANGTNRGWTFRSNGTPKAQITGGGHIHAKAGLSVDTTITAKGNIRSGSGSGGVALTINDGHGNANVTFNHQNGVPEQNGNSARMEVNTDASTGAYIRFLLKSGVTSSAAHVLPEAMKITETTGTLHGATIFTAAHEATSAEAAAGTANNRIMTPRRVKEAIDDRITVSTADPSGGVDGDVWMVVE